MPFDMSMVEGLTEQRPLIIDSFAGGGGASAGILNALGISPDVAHQPRCGSAGPGQLFPSCTRKESSMTMDLSDGFTNEEENPVGRTCACGVCGFTAPSRELTAFWEEEPQAWQTAEDVATADDDEVECSNCGSRSVPVWMPLDSPKWTVGICHRNGKGTTFISCTQAPDMETAKKWVGYECLNNWGDEYTTRELMVRFVALGDVNFAVWIDDGNIDDDPSIPEDDAEPETPPAEYIQEDDEI